MLRPGPLHKDDTMRTNRLLLALATLAIPLALPTAALADGGIYTASSGERVAVGGYDPVTYFRGRGTPIKGSARFKLTWKGAAWHFSSKANADAFKANPTGFAPQYGGHCAWAMAQGYLAPGDPTAYDIVGGKLYLNYDQDIRAKWRANIAGFIAKGGPNWAKVPAGKTYGGSSWFGF